jgi:hypothetical protein
MKSKHQRTKKKAYTSPRLVTYGDFRALTRATTKGGANADGGKPQTRASGPQG